MPASGASMAAPFGRVTSGRGFAPSSYQPHELPAAGQFTKDLPFSKDLSSFGGSQPNQDSWLRQAKMAQGLQGITRPFEPNQIPSAISGDICFCVEHVLAGMNSQSLQPISIIHI